MSTLINLENKSKKRAGKSSSLHPNRLTGLLFAAPATLVLGIFGGFTILFGIYVSMFDWGIKAEKFIGLNNYIALIGDKAFWQSMQVTIYYVLMVVPAELFLALLLATLLKKQFKGRAIIRLLFFLPYITSLVAAGLVFRWIFNPNQGLINLSLSAIGLSQPKWLLESRGILMLLGQTIGIDITPAYGGPSLALVVVALTTVWYYTGVNSIIFLAGLTAIPSTLYDAAKVDGANRWQSFRHVTLPLVSPTFYALAIMVTIGAFQSFSLIYAMTGSGYGVGSSGAPLGTTKVITLFIFDEFYRYTNTGYAMSATIVLLIILVILTIFQERFFGRRVVYLGGKK